jgi:Dolichyl-phosphate-mannose-protein mannosyltransferase
MESLGMKREGAAGTVWTWWSALAVAIAYVLVPGPRRSPFSGIPLSSKATLLFVLLLLLVVLTAFYRPQRRPRLLWSILLLVLIGLKLVLEPMLVHSGWKGVYRTRIRIVGEKYSPLRTEWFRNRGPAAQKYRIDRVIDFIGTSFGLTYINEMPYPYAEPEKELRQVVQPLIVQWTAYTAADQARPLRLTLTAVGRVAVHVDGKRIADVRSPTDAVVETPLSAGVHKVVVTYVKRIREAPAVRVLTDAPLTVTPATTQQIRAGTRAARAIDLAGLLALLILFAAFVDAWRPLRELLLNRLWARPDRLAAWVVVVAFMAIGSTSIRSRNQTIEILNGHDPLVYEGSARRIARNGLLMVDDDGSGESYFFYPFYSYALAGAHIVLGDDYSNVRLFNHMCASASVLLIWVLLRRHLSGRALALVLLFLVGPFIHANYGGYANEAFTDNLFAPVVLGMIVASAAAFRTRKLRWLLLAGFLTALGAAVRTSLLTHIAFIGLAVLLYRELGSFRRRIVAGAVLSIGFLVGVAPFTLRNWLVANELVLIVSSVGQMPYFMNYMPDWTVPINTSPAGRIATFTESLGQMAELFRLHPLRFIVHELRKIFFTLGFVNFVGPPGTRGPLYLMAIPPLFALALRSRRIPKALAWSLLAFCASHMLAMVMAAPWTYGYKTVLPFMLACMTGGALLLRGRETYEGSAPEPVPVPLPQKPRVSVVVIGAADPGPLVAIGADDVVAAEPDGGYGLSARRAIDRSTGDVIVVLPSPDAAGDLRKLLAFADDYDVVTSRREGGGQAWRWAVAKLVAIMYDTRAVLTDPAPAMLLIRREAWEKLRSSIREEGDAFTVELLTLALRAGLRVTEVPAQGDAVRASGPAPRTAAILRVLLRPAPEGA